jgi:hypothetical protein
MSPSVGDDNVKPLLAAAVVALAIGAILVSHAFYALRFGQPLNKPEVGGGAMFAGFGLLLAFVVYKEVTFVPETGVSARVVPSSIRAGDETRVLWNIAGDVNQLRSLRIQLQGEETIITRREGAEPKVAYSVFPAVPVLDAQGPFKPKGVVHLTVPADTRPSMTSPDGNHIVDWSIHVVGERTNGGTFEEDYPVTIRPA